MIPDRLKAIIGKELRDLSKERIVLFGLLLGPLIMYILLGGFAAIGSQSAAKQAVKPLSTAIIYYGGPPDNATRRIAEYLGAPIYTNKTSPSLIFNRGYDAIVIIKENITRDLFHGEKPEITIIYKPSTLNWYVLNRPEKLATLINKELVNITAGIVKKYIPSITGEFLENPAKTRITFYYKGKTISQGQLLGLIMGVSLAIPLAVLMTGVAATQVAAISMGVEKEARTLEKLLTLPLRREELLLGKLVAVSILAMGGVASYMTGLYIYFALLSHSYSGATDQSQFALHFTIPLETLAITGIGLALALYSSIVLGFIIGSQAQDVRGSQLAANYLTMALAIPLFIMFFGIDPSQFSTPVKLVLAIDPYALLGMASTASINGSYTLSILSILGLLLHSIFWTLLASRLLNSEAMIVGHPLFKRIKVLLAKKRRR